MRVPTFSNFDTCRGHNGHIDLLYDGFCLGLVDMLHKARKMSHVNTFI